ncbi:MAG: hypothetical protein GY832_31655 [Chloroflexi bacterium]|nr:hypothetical protein [Chloroflexota bacterium]
MEKQKTVLLKLTEQELAVLVQAFGEVNVAVKNIDEYVTPIKAKLERAVAKFQPDAK